MEADCFNGAAIRRRRRAVLPPSSHQLATRFNGAAIRRRRRASCSCSTIATHQSASTEPPSEDGGELVELDKAWSRCFALQRSRHPKTAERWPQEAWCDKTTALQRSRHPKTAESHGDVRYLDDRVAGFNGAAIRRRRRASTAAFERIGERNASTEPPSEDGGETAVVVQQPDGTGRFNGAAIRRRRRGRRYVACHARGRAASTEPPSEDGGEPP